jgi:hypothetical protein
MSVYTIDTRPQGVALKAYAGDTLAFNIITDTDYTTYAWSGQVRASHDNSGTVVDVDGDAEFDFGTTTAGTGDNVGKWVTPVSLSSASTRALADTVIENPTPSTADAPSLQTYSGVWDIQVSLGGVVQTLVQGTITVDADVTRV